MSTRGSANKLERHLVLTTRTPEFDHSILDQHYAFLNRLRAMGLIEMGGAFKDGSGGAYILLAESLEQATAIAKSDPLHVNKSSIITVRRWAAT